MENSFIFGEMPLDRGLPEPGIGTMARLPEEQIDRIKSEVSVQRLAESRGVVLKTHGQDLIGLCPFHDDHEPSLVITPKKNLWHCLGACRAGGSVIDWVMKAEGISFRHAAEMLRDDLPLTSAGPPPKRSTSQKMPPLLHGEADDAVLLGRVVRYYHETLKQSPAALEYLHKRGLRSSEMIGHFRLGYADRTLGYRLPPKVTKDGESTRGRLQRIGIVRASGHEHFNGSLVIPVFNGDGMVTEMYGRKVQRSLRKETPRHLYLPGPHRGVFNIEALAASEEIILCEALLDALAFWCAGYRNVTASYGIEGFTDDHMAAFKKHGTMRVLIAYDRDDAGERAAVSLAQRLMAEGIECYRIQFPKGMDAAEYALKVQPASQSLGVVIRAATWLGKGRRPDGDLLRGTLPPQAGAAKEIKRPRSATSNRVAQKNESPQAPEPNPKPIVESISEPDAVDAPSTSLVAETEPPLALASPLPAPPDDETPVDVSDNEIVIRLGDRRYRVRGLAKNMSYDQMRINILVSRGDDPLRGGDSPLRGDGNQPNGGIRAGFHVDTLDLYTARHRTAFTRQAAEELGVKDDIIHKDLGRVLLRLEQLQEARITKALTPEDKTVRLTDEEKENALTLLRDKNLLDRILDDFDRCGVVGEKTNKLMGYLAAVSRKLDDPLGIVIQSTSAAGKTALMEAVLAFVPEEDRVQYSAMTGQSLFYMGESDLKHKTLAIVEEEGAQRASYALKLLQSEGELTIASTGKDAASGRLVTHEYRVEGPVQLFLTTTSVDIDEELLNRCIVLTVDEDREQTKAIHRLQRRRQTLSGLLADHDRTRLLKTHRDAQRLLRPLLVANPYAEALTFADDRTRMRRDHTKYLTLIRTITLLHQHQRPIRTVHHDGKDIDYIEVTPDDIAVANTLADEVLGRSLDELPPQTRRLLTLIDAMVSAECQRTEVDRCDYRFSRRDVREHVGWGNTQLKLHLHRLEELEYLLVHRGGRGQSFEYELLYDRRGKDGNRFVVGLIDAAQLRDMYDPKKSGQNAGWSGSNGEKSGGGRPQVAPKSGGCRVGEISVNALPIRANSTTGSNPEKTHIGGEEENSLSYMHVGRSGAEGIA